jgi:hypothetical protein
MVRARIGAVALVAGALGGVIPPGRALMGEIKNIRKQIRYNYPKWSRKRAKAASGGAR